jgi:hypothetical protein
MSPVFTEYAVEMVLYFTSKTLATLIKAWANYPANDTFHTQTA